MCYSTVMNDRAKLASRTLGIKDSKIQGTQRTQGFKGLKLFNTGTQGLKGLKLFNTGTQRTQGLNGSKRSLILLHFLSLKNQLFPQYLYN